MVIIYDCFIGSTAFKVIYHMCYIVFKSHCEYFSEDLNSLYLAMIWVSYFFISSRLSLFLKIKVIMPCLNFFVKLLCKKKLLYSSANMGVKIGQKFW